MVSKPVFPGLYALLSPGLIGGATSLYSLIAVFIIVSFSGSGLNFSVSPAFSLSRFFLAYSLALAFSSSVL